MVTLQLHIDNDYELYGSVTTTAKVTAPPPPIGDDEAAGEWEWDHIFPVTGTERFGGDAAYYVTVTASSHPDLVAVGTEYEFV